MNQAEAHLAAAKTAVVGYTICRPKHDFVTNLPIYRTRIRQLYKKLIAKAARLLRYESIHRRLFLAGVSRSNQRRAASHE